MQSKRKHGIWKILALLCYVVSFLLMLHPRAVKVSFYYTETEIRHAYYPYYDFYLTAGGGLFMYDLFLLLTGVTVLLLCVCLWRGRCRGLRALLILLPVLTVFAWALGTYTPIGGCIVLLQSVALLLYCAEEDRFRAYLSLPYRSKKSISRLPRQSGKDDRGQLF